MDSLPPVSAFPGYTSTGQTNQFGAIQLKKDYDYITYLFRATVGALLLIITLGSAYGSEMTRSLFSSSHTTWAKQEETPKTTLVATSALIEPSNPQGYPTNEAPYYNKETRIKSPVTDRNVHANYVIMPGFTLTPEGTPSLFISWQPKEGAMGDQIYALLGAGVGCILDLTHVVKDGEENHQIFPYYLQPGTCMVHKISHDYFLMMTDTTAENGGNLREISISCEGHEETRENQSATVTYYRHGGLVDCATPESSQIIVDLAKILVAFRKKHPNFAINVHSRNSLGYAGVVVTLASILMDMKAYGKEQWKGDAGKSRIAQFILILRRQYSPQCIQIPAQLKLLEDLVSKAISYE